MEQPQSAIAGIEKFIKAHLRPTVLLALLLAAIVYLYSTYPRNSAALLPHGKAVFYRIGIFNREEHDLIIFRGQWYVIGGEPFASHELLVPFERPYNQYKNLRFENFGKVYMVEKQNQKREELRVVDGEWSYDASDHWQSIFDIDVD